MNVDARLVERQIERNVRVHDKVARKYDAVHGEIFNDIEQARLLAALTTATDAVTTGADPIQAFDFGSCVGRGTGGGIPY